LEHQIEEKNVEEGGIEMSCDPQRPGLVENEVPEIQGPEAETVQ
jgi:hypothetical protein